MNIEEQLKNHASTLAVISQIEEKIKYGKA
jgi:hypothetical protein